MNELTSNPILEFNLNQMKEVRKIFGYDDIKRLQQDIILLQDWIKKQQHFLITDYDAVYLERHLICSKGSIERAKKLMDKLCTLRGLMPEYLQNFDIENEFNVLWNSSYTCMLPRPTPDNYRILYITYHNPDGTVHDPKETARYLLLEAVGLRVKRIHFISGSKFFDSLLAICKSALSNKLKSRIHVHESYDAMSKFIPKDMIPKDLGGDFPSTVKEINENNFKEFSSPGFIERIKYFEGAVTDESKRLSSKFNEEYSGMPGSFKVLSVD